MTAAATPSQPEAEKQIVPQKRRPRDLLAPIAAFIRRAAGFFEPLRILVVNTLVIVAVIVGGFSIYKLAAKTSFVVKDISVPAALQERGVTGAVIAQQILDQIAEINAAAGSRKQKAEISGLDFQSTMPTINLPVGGFNIAAIVSELRHLLGYKETVITGEVFTEESGDKDKPAKYGFRLRIAGEGPIYKSDAPDADVQRLIASGAERIMHKFDPINLGYFYFRQQDYEKAEETVDAALASDAADNYPWAYTMRGLVARAKGKLAEAAKNFRQVVDLDPNFGMGYVHLAGILRQDGQLDAAEAAARKAIELMPKQHEGYAALAHVYVDRGKRDEALAEMGKGVAVDSKDAQSHLALGKICHRLERYPEAIEAFQTSAKITPAAAPLIGAANASAQLSRHDDELAYLRRATQTEPKSVDAWMAYGGAALRAHDPRTAEKAFDKARTLAPASPQPVIELAAVQSSQKRYPAAEAIFDKYERAFQHDAKFLLAWSSLFQEQGKLDQAKDKMLAAQAEAALDAQTLETVAKGLEARGDLSEAIVAYRKIVAADPKMAETINPLIDKLSARLPLKSEPAPEGKAAPRTAAAPPPVKPR